VEERVRTSPIGCGFAVRDAWARPSHWAGLPFWVDLKLEPATIAHALLLALEPRH
jgi:hypothetical protein